MAEELNDRTVREWGERYSNWGRWGDDDQHGTLNFITRERVLAACAIPQTGRVISCALLLDPLPSGANQGADTDPTPLRCGTQWDALAHVCYDGKMYNDRDIRTVGMGAVRADFIDQFSRGVIGRGVLLDLPRYQRLPWLDDRTRIRPDDLDGTAEAFGVTIQSGDIVLIRTGRMARCKERGSWETYATEPASGLSAHCARWIFEREIAAVATDTWAIEARPSEVPDCSEPLHRISLRNTGLLFGRVFDLDELADACAADGRYEFLFVTAPLPVAGAVGSPINPIAIK
jgi:kynurenine formamidase